MCWCAGVSRLKFISKTPLYCFICQFTRNLIYYKNLLRFRVPCETDGICFLTKKLCCRRRGGLAVKESHSWRIVGSLFAKRLPRWRVLEQDTGASSRRRFARGGEKCTKMTEWESVEASASVVRSGSFHSLTRLLHRPTWGVLELSGRFELLLLLRSVKGGHLCEGTRSPRHCQSSNDETITAYWAQLKI